LARELVNRIQRLRKDSDLEITDRIRLGVFGPDGISAPAREHRGFIMGEVLAVDMDVGGPGGGEGFRYGTSVDIDGVEVWIGLETASGNGDGS